MYGTIWTEDREDGEDIKYYSPKLEDKTWQSLSQLEIYSIIHFFFVKIFQADRLNVGAATILEV